MSSMPSGAQEENTRPVSWNQPCTINGLSSAFAAGVLGYVIGFLPSIVVNKFRSPQLWFADGWRSSKYLAIVSGVYTTIHCIMQRIRMTEDGWNRGFAGCMTGLALGFQSGPLGAAQSCAGFGFMSYIFDMGGQSDNAQAACCIKDFKGSKSLKGCASKPSLAARRDEDIHSLPPMMWLGHVLQPAYFAQKQ